MQQGSCVYVVSLMRSVCHGFLGRGRGDGDRSEARPAVTSSERQTDSGEADHSQPFRTLRVSFLRDVL